MLRWLRNSTKLLESNFVSCLPLLGVYSFIRLFNSKVLSTLLRSFSLLAAPLSSTQCSLSAESLICCAPAGQSGRKTLSELGVEREGLGESVWIPAELAPLWSQCSSSGPSVLWLCDTIVVLSGLHNTPISSIVAVLWSFYPSSAITFIKSSGNPPHTPRHMHRFVSRE